MKRNTRSVTPRKSQPPVMIQKPTQTVDIQRPTLGTTIKEGFALGVGSSMGHHAVNGLINFFTPPKSSNPVENSKIKEYEKCMKYSSNDIDICKSLLDN